MKRRLLPILMTLVLVCALPIWAAFVTSGDVTNPLVCTAGATSSEESAVEKLKLAISRGVDAQLTEDIEITQTLYVERSMTIDLNGHVLKMTGDGSVLKVSDRATLTITDSRSDTSHEDKTLPAGGVITGGTGTREEWTHYNTFGGAVFLEKDTTLKLEGGTLTGNSCSSIYIDGAIFVMSGGTITGEAVGVHNNVGTFTMTGGRITGCSEKGVYMYNGNMTMSGTAYIGGNGTNQYQYIETADIYVHEPVRKETGLSVTGGIIEGKVYIFFETSNMKPDGESRDDDYNVEALKSVAESVVKENGVLDGHIRVKMDDTPGTAVDYNTVNFIDEVAKTRTFQPIFVKGDKKARKPDDPDTVNGQAFMYWAKEGASEAWDFNTEIKGPLTLYAVRTPASSGGYYYYPTTDTKADDAKGSPKTADPGVALYAALSLLSLTGLTCTAKKR